MILPKAGPEVWNAQQARQASCAGWLPSVANTAGGLKASWMTRSASFARVPRPRAAPGARRLDTGEMRVIAIEHFLKANNWDKKTREFLITPIPGQITVHEFDYKGVNAVVYEEK
jgi:hypothetical protein